MDARTFTRQLRKAQGQVRPIEPKLQRAYHKALMGQAREAESAYHKAMDVTLAAAEPARSVDVDALLRSSETVGKAVQATQRDREQIANLTLGALVSDPDILTSTQERVQSLLLTQAGKQAERLVAGSRDVVADVIEDSLNEGWTVQQTAKTIRLELEQIAPYRATMLARTDLIGISNGTSQVAALSVEDGPGYKQWLTAGDESVRPTHQDAEGQVVPNDQPFDVGDASLFYPGDPDGPDDEVIQCRCTLIYTDDAEGMSRQHSDLLAAGGGSMDEEMQAAAVDFTGGSMIALYPRREEAFSLVMADGQLPEDLHCTLIQFQQPPNVNVVAPLLAQLANQVPPLTGQVGGVARFDAGADGTPVVALPDVLDLNELRAAIAMSLDAVGQSYSEQHGFVPHITIGYVGDPEAPLPDLSGIPLTFEAICLVVGNERLSFPFQNMPLAPLTDDDLEEAAEIEPFGRDVYDEGVGEMGTNIRASMITETQVSGTSSTNGGGNLTVVAAGPSETVRQKLADSGEALPDGSYPITDVPDLKKAIAAFGRAGDPEKVKAWITKRAKELDSTQLLPADWPGSTKTQPGQAVTAASAPLAPPAEWFEEPQFEKLTPLTVTADGQVFGHLAPWGQCHTGMDGRCTMAPRGLSYEYFHVGALDLADGSTVKAGKMTIGTGHAPLTASRAATAAHYDNTGTVVAFVRAGEDEHGPWLAGSVKSDATPEQIRDLKMNGPSGDWRRVRFADGSSRLELIGVLAVPVQGFPVAAMAASANGEEIMTLIAGSAYEGEPIDEELLASSLEGLAGRVDAARGRPTVTATEQHMASTVAVR